MPRRTQTVHRARRSAGTRRGHRQPLRHGTTTAPAFGRPTGLRSLRRRQPGTAADPIALGAGTWLACGVVMLGLTPLPLRDAHLGWSFTFWALAAPLVVLLARHIRRGGSWMRDEQRGRRQPATQRRA